MAAALYALLNQSTAQQRALTCNADIEQLVEAAGAQECSVQQVGAVGGTHNEDVAAATAPLQRQGSRTLWCDGVTGQR
jgi:hypothetical protein